VGCKALALGKYSITNYASTTNYADKRISSNVVHLLVHLMTLVWQSSKLTFGSVKTGRRLSRF